MLKIKIAVLVSGGGTNLGALLDAQKNKILTSGEICLVISNKPEAYALVRAAENGVKTAVIVSKNKTREEFDGELISVLKENSVGLVILAGFTRIFTKRFTDEFKDRIINVHPALIPSFCGDGFYGLKVHEAALNYGVKVTGATVHYVNEITDGGKIIMQKSVGVDESDTPETLQKRVMREAEWVILPLAAEKVCKKLLEEK